MSSDKKFQSVSVLKGIGPIDEIRRYKGEKIISMAKSISLKTINEKVINIPLAVDIYYTMYLPVPLPDYDLVNIVGSNQEILRRLMIVQNILASSKLQKIKNYTTADSLTSVVAAASFIERLNRILQMPAGGQGDKSERNKQKNLNEKSQDTSSGNSDKNLENFRSSIEKALEKTIEDAKVAKEVKGLIAKIGAGNTSILSYAESPEEVLKLARETDISKILEKLAGLKLILSRKSKDFRRYSKGWFTGVEFGRDLERLHHSQLALPEEVFTANFANDKLLLFEKSLNSSLGPIYVLLDKSGSMIGDKIYWARAVAVALLQKSISENRDFCVRFFDSMTHPLMRASKRSKPSIIMKVLMYLATVRAGGGTSISNAIFTAAEDLKKERKKRISDVVLITDGEDKINLNLLARIKSESKMRLHTVMIQGINQYLKKLSDRYLMVKRLDQEGILKVVEFSPSEAEFIS